MENFSIVKTKKGKEVLVYNENLYKIFNMNKNFVVSECDYLGRILSENQSPRWVEISNDSDTRYAFKGPIRVEKQNLISIFYGQIINDEKTRKQHERMLKRKETRKTERRNKKRY